MLLKRFKTHNLSEKPAEVVREVEQKPAEIVVAEPEEAAPEVPKDRQNLAKRAKKPGEDVLDEVEDVKLAEALLLLDTLDLDQVAQIRDVIDEKLRLGIHEFDLLEETTFNYRKVKRLLSRISAGGGVPVNQIAQVTNTLHAALRDIVKLQHVIISAERQKKFEAALVKTLQDPLVTDEFRRSFLDRYQLNLGDNDGQ